MTKVAARMRAMRKRRSEGRCIVPVEIDHEPWTAALCRLGLLAERDVDCKPAIGEALRRYLTKNFERDSAVTRNCEISANQFTSDR